MGIYYDIYHLQVLYPCAAHGYCVRFRAQATEFKWFEQDAKHAHLWSNR